MKLYFSLGFGLICKWYIDGLNLPPLPPLWVRDQMVRHCWLSNIHLGQNDDERDNTRHKVYTELKKL